MLFFGLAIASGIMTGISYIFGFVNKLYQLPIVYAVSYVVAFLLWALFCAVSTCFVDINKNCRKPNRLFRFFTDCIIDGITHLFRIKLHVNCPIELPKEKFLLVGNHCSNFDPILEMGVCRKYNIGFVAKMELFSIPLVRMLMHKCFCLPMNRNNNREGMRTCNKAAEIIKSQTASIGIYPEGTVSADKLLPFKNGAFKIAKKAKCPIVVVVIKNSEKIMKNVPFRKTDVYLDFVGVLDSEFVSGEKTEQISAKVREMMERTITPHKELAEAA